MSRVFRRKPSKGAAKPLQGRFHGVPQTKSSLPHPDGGTSKGPLPLQRRRPKMDPSTC